MRILLATRGSPGRLGPLVPFARACRRAGHEVLVAAQRRHGADVERAGLPFAPLADPPDEEWMPHLAELGRLGVDAAEARTVGELFARVDVRAALPGLRALVERRRPDLVVGESREFASTLVAELHGIPLVRVALGLGAREERSIALAAPALAPLRAELGLPPDPAGDRLRDPPLLTMVPAPLEDPDAPAPRRVLRFRGEERGPAPPLGDWWPGDGRPLVHLTLGSVTAAAHLPYFPALHRAALEAIAPLPVRLLLTTGDGADLAALGPLPPNVHAERRVPRDAVLAHAAVVVCHGGHGSILGALAHGVPLVVLPLFSGDQWDNARAVARVGAGVALDAERRVRRALALPGAETLAALGPAVARVLEHDPHREGARRIAAAMASLPPVGAAVGALAAHAAAAP